MSPGPTGATAVTLALAAWLAANAASDGEEKYARPTPGNQYVAVTAKNLYVVWSLPKSLAPVAHLRSDPDAIDAFFARTAIHLCAAERAALQLADKPCLVQIIRLKTNDEYSKSASAGFSTLARLLLAADRADAATLARSLGMSRAELVRLFQRFDVWHDRLS